MISFEKKDSERREECAREGNPDPGRQLPKVRRSPL